MRRYVHEKTIEDIAPMKPKKGAIASASAACAPVTHAARHATRRATLTFMLFFFLPSEEKRVRLALSETGRAIVFEDARSESVKVTRRTRGVMKPRSAPV